MKPFELIINFLKKSDITYQLIEHEPVFTSEQAAKVRGTRLSQGAKALLLKSAIGFALAVLPGNLRLDSGKMKILLGVKEFRFATPEEVEQVMGCKIGACYPFGNLINVRMLVDNELGNNKFISFNPGVHDKSLILKWQDYLKAVKPTLDDFSK